MPRRYEDEYDEFLRWREEQKYQKAGGCRDGGMALVLIIAVFVVMFLWATLQR